MRLSGGRVASRVRRSLANAAGKRLYRRDIVHLADISLDDIQIATRGDFHNLASAQPKPAMPAERARVQYHRAVPIVVLTCANASFIVGA